jgi:hypothetical protein
LPSRSPERGFSRAATMAFKCIYSRWRAVGAAAIGTSLSLTHAFEASSPERMPPNAAHASQGTGDQGHLARPPPATPARWWHPLPASGAILARLLLLPMLPALADSSGSAVARGAADPDMGAPCVAVLTLLTAPVAAMLHGCVLSAEQLQQAERALAAPGVVLSLAPWWVGSPRDRALAWVPDSRGYSRDYSRRALLCHFRRPPLPLYAQFPSEAQFPGEACVVV